MNAQNYYKRAGVRGSRRRQGRWSRGRKTLVLRLVDQLVLADPGHHAAELGADRLDGMLGGAPAHGLEARLASLVLQDPVAGEASGLDVVQDALHLGLGLVGDDPGPASIVAILGG